MKLSSLFLGFLAHGLFTHAAPTTTSEEALAAKRAELAKRATITDISTTGYASTNGG